MIESNSVAAARAFHFATLPLAHSRYAAARACHYIPFHFISLHFISFHFIKLIKDITLYYSNTYSSFIVA